MKVYAFGEPDAPAIVLLPGTCCDWKGNFETVIPLLKERYRVLCVSYDGFDRNEATEFPTMLEETEKIEDYIKRNCGGHIRAAYGCSLGGSFVGLLAARQKIDLLMPLFYPLVRGGQFKLRLLRKKMERTMREKGEYAAAFMKMFGGARPFITRKSCKNQFYSDLVTPLPDHIDTPTEIHVFYALKMGPKYRARYMRHFAHPILHEQDLQHEELLACYPKEWAELVGRIMEGKEGEKR